MSFNLEKAFDKVWRSYRDFSTPIILNIKSYLVNQTFRVKIFNWSSSSKHFLAGVPQDSALGPILFNFFYINDIPKPSNPSTKISLYADNTWIYLTHKAPTHTKKSSIFKYTHPDRHIDARFQTRSLHI